MTARRAAAVLLMGLCSAAAVRAQAPFSMIDLQVTGTRDISATPLHQNWLPGRGVSLEVVMPFYAGDMEFGSAIHRYGARTDVPGFAALWLYGGWGVHYRWQRRVTLRTSVRLGYYRMSFDGAEGTFAGESVEGELATDAGAGLSIRVHGPVSVSGRIDRLRIHTMPVLDFWYLSVGLGVRLRAGDRWIGFFE